MVQEMSIKPLFSINESFEDWFPFISLHLILLVMEADILGVSKRDFLSFNQGESLITQEKFIKEVSAY